MTHRRSLSDADILTKNSSKINSNHGGPMPPIETQYNRDKDGMLKPRKIIGDYRLAKTIGQGSMGKVKIAIHQKTGEKVCILKTVIKKKKKSFFNLFI